MTELIWKGKYDDHGRLRPIERIALTSQVMETFAASRPTQEQAPLLGQGGAPEQGKCKDDGKRLSTL